jgi:hypothetical protein
MPHIYQIKITLLNTKPTIWRRVLVHGNATLAEFHRVFQIVMGWEDYHLHEFRLGEERFGIPDPDIPHPSETDCTDDRTVLLSELLRAEGSEATYIYDFGDWWEHSLLLERTAEAEAGAMYPICTEGARRCPPEDVGGAFGYEEFLEAIRNPKHEQHEEMLQWIGGRFDPDAFSVNGVNKKLARSQRGHKNTSKVN